MNNRKKKNNVNSVNEYVYLKNNNVKEMTFEHSISIHIFDIDLNNYL